MGKYGNLIKNSAPKEPQQEESTPTPRDIKTSSKVSTKISNEISPSVTNEEYDFRHSVRRAIRWPGKENSPLRITEEELNKLKAAVRHFEDRGQLTDRTQIIRALISYGLDDFERNGDNSILAQIMDCINNY